MHGQVISPEPLSKAINFVKNKIQTPQPPLEGAIEKNIPIIYMSPS